MSIMLSGCVEVMHAAVGHATFTFAARGRSIETCESIRKEATIGEREINIWQSTWRIIGEISHLSV